ncbi:DUF2500 domain-containing protein [Vibrio rarus]|uniref:DUF2500 domain-containing protein n=1 Tax=Vibrio rarus TaxID=413403 RepID=UPI0021C3043A|nr:DUF2500 domain-containing protein [Vibrio rarus]
MPTSLFTALLITSFTITALIYLIKRRRGPNTAPTEQTATVTIIDKKITQISDSESATQGQEYWISVQKGPLRSKRDFKVGIHYYHALLPGYRGELTHQGETFLGFTLKR